MIIMKQEDKNNGRINVNTLYGACVCTVCHARNRRRGLEVLYDHCKPLRDRIDKQVEKYMEDEEE